MRVSCAIFVLRLVLPAGTYPSPCRIEQPEDWATCSETFSKPVEQFCDLNPKDPNFSWNLFDMTTSDKFARGLFHFSDLMTPKDSGVRYALNDPSLDQDLGWKEYASDYSKQLMLAEVVSVIFLCLIFIWTWTAFIYCCCISCCRCCRICCGKLCCVQYCLDRDRKIPFYEMSRSKLITFIVGWSCIGTILLYIIITSAYYGAIYTKSIDADTLSCSFVGNAYRVAYGYDGWGGLADLHITMDEQVQALDPNNKNSYYNILLSQNAKIDPATKNLSGSGTAQFFQSLGRSLTASQGAEYRHVHLASLVSTNYQWAEQPDDLSRCNARQPYVWGSTLDPSQVELINATIFDCYRAMPTLPPQDSYCSDFFNLTMLQAEFSQTFACVNFAAIEASVGPRTTYAEATAELSRVYYDNIQNVVDAFNDAMGWLKNLVNDVETSNPINIVDYLPWAGVGFTIIAFLVFVFVIVLNSYLLYFCMRGKEPKRLKATARSYCGLWLVLCLTGIPIAYIAAFGLMGVSLSADGCNYMKVDIQENADFSLYWPNEFITKNFNPKNQTQFDIALQTCLSTSQPQNDKTGSIIVAAGLDDDMTNYVIPSVNRTMLFLNESYNAFFDQLKPLRTGLDNTLVTFNNAADAVIPDWWSLIRTMSYDKMQLLVPAALLYVPLRQNLFEIPVEVSEKLDIMSLELGPQIRGMLAGNSDWPNLRDNAGELVTTITSSASNFTVGFNKLFEVVVTTVNQEFVSPSGGSCATICMSGKYTTASCPNPNDDIIIDSNSLVIPFPSTEKDFWGIDGDGDSFQWSLDIIPNGKLYLILKCITGITEGAALPSSPYEPLSRSVFFINAYNLLVRKAKSIDDSSIWKKPIQSPTDPVTSFPNFNEFVKAGLASGKLASQAVTAYFEEFEAIGIEQMSLLTGALDGIDKLYQVANCLKITIALFDSLDVACEHYGPFAAVLFWNALLYGIVCFFGFVLAILHWHYWKDRLRMSLKKDDSSYIYDDPNQITTLMVVAILEGDNVKLKKYGALAEPSTLYRGGNGMLHYAARVGNLENVEYLLQSGCNIDELNAVGYTPLLIATSEFHTDCVKELLEWGANPAVADEFGDTPLHIAARSGNLEMVKIILTSGVDPEIKTSNSRVVAEDIALQMGQRDVENFLSEAKSPQSRRAREKEVLDFKAVVEKHKKATGMIAVPEDSQSGKVSRSHHSTSD